MRHRGEHGKGPSPSFNSAVGVNVHTVSVTRSGSSTTLPLGRYSYSVYLHHVVIICRRALGDHERHRHGLAGRHNIAHAVGRRERNVYRPVGRGVGGVIQDALRGRVESYGACGRSG